MSAEDVAARLLELGVAPGEGVLVALVDATLVAEASAAVELVGAVVVPDTDDPASVIASGRVQHVIAHSADTGFFNDVAGNCTRIVVGRKVPGWAAYPT